jgi:hypothetical protein
MPSGRHESDATLPPTGLRPRRDDDARRGGPQPRGLRAFESDEGPAASPISPEERRGPRAERDAIADSPLRRPTPQARSLDAPQSRPVPPQGRSSVPPQGRSVPPPPSRPVPPPPRGLDRPPRTPVPPRDGSDRRFDDVFNMDDFGSDATVPPSTNQAALTTASMPAVRRRETPAGPGPAGLGPTHPPAGAPTAPAPVPVADEDETSGGAGVLRWVVVLVLIALGAAFGIWLGQLLIR